MPRPTLANAGPIDEHRKQYIVYLRQTQKRCESCPPETQKDTAGEFQAPPELNYIFAFGGDDEGIGMTSIYQCPKCKTVYAK